MKFVLNKGRRCAQTAIKSVLDERELSWGELDKLTQRRGDQITCPVQIAYALDKLGVDFIYPVKEGFYSLSEQGFQERSRQMFGKENYSKANFGAIEEARASLIDSGKVRKVSVFGLGQIREYVHAKRKAICLINIDIFSGRTNEKKGHYLVVHDNMEGGFIVMDSGPAGADSSKRVSNRRLDESLMQTPIDFGVVVAG